MDMLFWAFGFAVVMLPVMSLAALFILFASDEPTGPHAFWLVLVGLAIATLCMMAVLKVGTTL